MAMATSAEVVVRQAGEDDLDAVVSVLRAANAEFERVVPSSFYRAYLENVLDVRSRLHEAELLIAERARRAVVGAITLYPRASDEGWGWPSHWTGIRAVAVPPSERGTGIGRRLAEACVERSRELGAEVVALHTASFMAAAMAMYESVGFHRAPEFDGDAAEMFGVGPIEPQIVALAYRLELRS